MYEYVHGGDIYSAKEQIGKEEILDFSVNTNPLGLPEEVKQAIEKALADSERYPDPFCRELTAALAEYEKTNQDYILCGNGASDIIFRLALALKPKKALLCAPTFADYEKALKTVDCDIDYYYLSGDEVFSVGIDFIDKINTETDMVYICNPNNPTGQLCSKSFIQRVLDRCRETKTVVLIDECFIDFIDQPEEYSVQPFVEAYSNLVILKAFTKIYAMAGIRLGYTITSNKLLIEKMRTCGQDWGVSSLAQAAGISALKLTDYIKDTKRLIPEERNFLIGELTKFGFEIFGSKANYIFFKTNAANNVLNLNQRLLSKGILIRACSNYNNLDSNFYRVAVKKRSDNMKLIEALKEVIDDENNDDNIRWAGR